VEDPARTYLTSALHEPETMARPKVPTGSEAWWLASPLVAILGECYAWLYLVRSYRLLNGAKYWVVAPSKNACPPRRSGVRNGGLWVRVEAGHSTGRCFTSSSGSQSYSPSPILAGSRPPFLLSSVRLKTSAPRVGLTTRGPSSGATPLIGRVEDLSPNRDCCMNFIAIVRFSSRQLPPPRFLVHRGGGLVLSATHPGSTRSGMPRRHDSDVSCATGCGHRLFIDNPSKHVAAQTDTGKNDGC
jgi:hypothetical protein